MATKHPGFDDATPGVDGEKPPSSGPVSVVIPVYNEAGAIPGLADECDSVFDADARQYEIWWVDDGSDDGTAAAIDRLARTRDRHHAIHLRRNFGQSAALAAGIEHCHGTVICPMDGDGQNDPADIPRLVAALDAGDHDCVSGRRVDRDDPLGKRVPSRIQTTLAKYTGPDVHDFGCTLKAYRASALADIDLYGEGHRYIPAKLHKKGYSVDERAVRHRPRAHGSSHYGPGRLVRGFVDLLFHWFWVRYSTRPLHLFGLAGFVAMGIGATLGGWSLVERFLLGVALGPRTPRLILTALLLIFGLQLLVFGVITEILTKLHYRDEDSYRVAEVIE